MIITITSYRGGSGKSLFALNLAAKLTTTHKTLLLEADFLAPSLIYTALNLNSDFTWNDYILGKCSQETLIQRLKIEEDNLDIVCTKPNDPNLFHHIQNKDLWKGTFFERINQFLSEQKKKQDFIIIDNQSGMFLSAATHTFFSDFLICIARPDKTDVPGTYNYLKMLKTTFYLVWNKTLNIPEMNSLISNWNEKLFNELDTFQGCLAHIPFDEKTIYQRWIKGDIIIHDTDYTKEIEKVASKIIEIRESSKN